MSWQNLVGQQKAAEHLARVLGHVAQGGEVPGVLEPPLLDTRGRGRGGRRRHRELAGGNGQSRGRSQHRALPFRRESESDGTSLCEFCEALYDQLDRMDRGDPVDMLERAFRELASRGWRIDLDMPR